MHQPVQDSQAQYQPYQQQQQAFVQQSYQGNQAVTAQPLQGYQPPPPPQPVAQQQQQPPTFQQLQPQSIPAASQPQAQGAYQQVPVQQQQTYSQVVQQHVTPALPAAVQQAPPQRHVPMLDQNVAQAQAAPPQHPSQMHQQQLPSQPVVGGPDHQQPLQPQPALQQDVYQQQQQQPQSSQIQHQAHPIPHQQPQQQVHPPSGQQQQLLHQNPAPQPIAPQVQQHAPQSGQTTTVTMSQSFMSSIPTVANPVSASEELHQQPQAFPPVRVLQQPAPLTVVAGGVDLTQQECQHQHGHPLSQPQQQQHVVDPAPRVDEVAQQGQPPSVYHQQEEPEQRQKVEALDLPSRQPSLQGPEHKLSHQDDVSGSLPFPGLLSIILSFKFPVVHGLNAYRHLDSF